MDDERGYYERYWSNPDAAPPASDPTTPLRKSMLQSALAALKSGGRALDFGCGTGEFADFLGGLGYDAAGVDLSESAIRVAKQRFPSRQFFVCDPSGAAPADIGRFAAVWSSEVIEHVFDVYGFLAAAHACLEPGGLFVLTTPYHGLIKNILIDLAGYERHYQPFGGHIRFFSRKSLFASLRHCGFTPIKCTGYGRPWPLYKSFFAVAQKTHEPAPRPPADS